MSQISTVLSPREVVERYLDTLYSQHRIDLVKELVAPNTWRHTPGGVIMLTIEESVTRIGAFLDRFTNIRFISEVMVVQGSLVTAIWSAWLKSTEGKDLELGGIEVFRVVEGKIVEVWNQEPAASRGVWQASRVTEALGEDK